MIPVLYDLLQFRKRKNVLALAKRIVNKYLE